MGTRHITAVVNEGQFVVAQYGQWDGYPTEVLNILSHTEVPVELYLNVDFIGDGLFCEWVYVVDLDSNMFEIYRGSQIHPSENRFSTMFEGTTDGYYPPKLVATYPLDDLPTDSQLQRLEKDCEQD